MNADNAKPQTWLSICVLGIFFASLACAEEWQAWGPFGGTAVSIAVDPRDASQILTGARDGQLFRSTDRGATWRQLSFGRFLAGNVKVVAIDPSLRTHYWVGVSGEQASSNGLWESRDAGVTWMQTLTGLGVESLALFPGKSSTVAVGTRHGLFLTTDGEHWTRVTPEGHPDLEDIVSLAFDPGDARVIYAGTPHLPWKTTDGGKNWTAIHTGMIDDSDVFSLHVSASNGANVFASACSGIYRSQDAGGHWKLLQGIPNTSRRTHVITQHPSNPGIIFAGTTDGLFRSTDAGGAWTRLNHLQINAIAFDPLRPETLYLATEHGGVQISTDGGTTIRPSNDGFHARNVTAAAGSGSLQYVSTAYEGSEGGVFVRSGVGWRGLGGTVFMTENVRSLAVTKGGLLASTGDRLLQSKDGGRAWSKLSNPPPGSRYVVAGVGSETWVGADRGVFRLSEGGWRKAVATTSQVRAIRSVGQRVIVRTDTSALISPDAGMSWRTIQTKGLFDAAVSCQGSVLLATSAGLLVTRGAASPTPAVGIPDGTVSAVVFHESRCLEAYAVQFGALYKSVDGGSHWAAVDAVSPLADVTTLWMSESADDLLFATVPGAGVFRLKIPR
jgi:photosystem II stability/assembly factor-like uncharacterized protein